jgi:hypothetical protein
MKIPSKSEFFRLWELGVLGNRTLLWRSLEDALASGVPKIGFRLTARSAGGSGAWELGTREQAPEIFARWKAAGRDFIMDGSVPNDRSIMQGEVCRGLHGLASYCATGHGLPPMRQTMAAGLHQHRGYLETKLLLDRYMDPSSRDDLEMLLELYPDATVELACFDIQTGVFPNRNTIFWEVRDY